MLPKFDARDFGVMQDSAQGAAILEAVKTPAVVLSAADVGAIVAFLDTLTDPVARTGRLGVPETVPSGLPVPH